MMGVSPVTLDDVTSGYNVGWNISVKPEFNEMQGFSTVVTSSRCSPIIKSMAVSRRIVILMPSSTI